MSKEEPKYWFYTIAEDEIYRSRLYQRIERTEDANAAIVLFFRLMARAVKNSGKLLDANGDALALEDLTYLVNMPIEQAEKAAKTLINAGALVLIDGVYNLPEVLLYAGSRTRAADRMKNKRKRDAMKQAAEEATGDALGVEEPTPEPEPIREPEPTPEPEPEPKEEAAPEPIRESETQKVGDQERPEPPKEAPKIVNLKGEPVTEPDKPTEGDAIQTIVDYLNQKTGRKYNARTTATRKHICARMKEGYTIDDFRAVIDNRVRAWSNDPKMKEYLRPETLFGQKFDGYLQMANEDRAGIWADRGDKLSLEQIDKLLYGEGGRA